MRKRLVCIVVICLISVFAFTRTEAQQSQRVGITSSAVTVDDVLKMMRIDLQGNRADVMAKNMTLTSEQAAKFWPVFQKYQAEQNTIIDEQLKSVQGYVDKSASLDDANALALINSYFDRDAKMNALRQKWLPEFQKVLPTKLAVRAMQIDRRLSLETQVQIAARIPLIQ
jgi:Spy/CpxP family protein refolding chaperone